MSWIKGIFLFLVFLPASWTRVSRLNAAIDQAAVSYAATAYAQSIKDHRVLIEEFQLVSEYLDFNLGLSYKYANQPEEAAANFDKASQSTDERLTSFAFNQGGVVLGDKKDYQAALSKFQSALIQNPLNEEARYNYELLARWLKRDEERKNKDESTPEPSEFCQTEKSRGRSIGGTIPVQRSVNSFGGSSCSRRDGSRLPRIYDKFKRRSRNK